MDDATYWVVTASADHAAKGRALGIVQAGHGKHAPVKRMAPGDGVVVYSPRQSFPDGPPCHAFTAIGRVAPGNPYQADMGNGFVAWRRDMVWRPSRNAPIHPLLGQLDLTKGQVSWGMAFRYGLRQISRADFALIARMMVQSA
jgi:hypothetical protein